MTRSGAIRALLVFRRILQPEQRPESLAYVSEDFDGSLGLKHHPSGLPVEILYVIRQYDAGDLGTGRQWNLEGITLYLAGDRTGDCEPRLRVVNARRKNQRGATAALLVAGLGIKRQPDQITRVWNVRAGYHVSWPTGVPQSVSLCRFRGVISETSCSRE